MKTNIMQRVLQLLILLLILSVPISCKKKNDNEESFSFAFITDIHLQPEKNADKGFLQAIDTINSLKPDFVLTGGDMIMDALGQTESRADSLYNLYIELSSNLEMPLYNTIGNHEVFGLYEQSGIDPSHPLYGDGMFEEKLGPRYYAFNHKGWRFYVLDGIDEREERKGYYGHIDNEQIEWLKKDLASVDPGTPMAISIHIPFISVQTQIVNGATAANNDGVVITNSKEVLSLFDAYNLKLVLQGHLHYLEAIYAEGIQFITGGAVSASWWDGPRRGMQEGFLMLTVKDEEVNWEYIDYGWEAE